MKLKTPKAKLKPKERFIGLPAIKKKGTKNNNISTSAFKWTPALKKAACSQLLRIANLYEVKKRKRLVKVRYQSDGLATWEGQAHNYSFHCPEVTLKSAANGKNK